MRRKSQRASENNRNRLPTHHHHPVADRQTDFAACMQEFSWRFHRFTNVALRNVYVCIVRRRPQVRFLRFRDPVVPTLTDGTDLCGVTSPTFSCNRNVAKLQPPATSPIPGPLWGATGRLKREHTHTYERLICVTEAAAMLLSTATAATV